MKQPITLQEAITRDIGEIGTPERDKFDAEVAYIANNSEDIDPEIQEAVNNTALIKNQF